ncbi:MAG: BTAD domain-containing putative transcriptional regulator [Symbiobacterium sp.]|uniref:BTAD domain-containing putative transcriptional regulator n=1 Tax=Symbiobacterium sp. TaxID=1971213 RepID=UPI0034641763
MEREVPLTAKILRPSNARFYLPRPHLAELLREGLTRRLTVLLASAGYGKTATLASFAAEAGVPVLWIQLDPGDSQLYTFLRCLARGIQRELGGGSELLRALEGGAALTDPLPLILGDLAACPGHHMIVLDDFHLIDRESPVVGLVHRLVQYAGEQTHLYICSRTALPFPTARLKVIQEAAEVTEDDLRFSREETASFLTGITGETPSPEELEQVQNLTEGWSAALVLLTSAARRRGGLGPLLSGGLPGDLFAYLADEVLSGLGPHLQAFMEQSSILDVLSPTVCDEVLERQDSAALLCELSASSLLVIQVGPDTYRYHHLLQRFLQDRLRARSSGDFARLCKQAGDWYLQRDEPEEAVKHYLRGGWLQEAAGLAESLAPEWLRTHKLERLRTLLSELPQTIKEQYPWITLCEARYLMHTGRSDHAVGMARLALRAFSEYGDRRGVVQAHILLGDCYAIRQELAASEAEFARAAEALEPEFRQEEAFLLLRRAGLAYMTGKCPSEVEADLRRALSLYVELGDLPGEGAVSDLLGVVRAQQSDYASAIQLLERAVAIARSMGEPAHEVGINLAWVYLEVGRFQDVVTLCEPVATASTNQMRRLYAGIYLISAYTHLGEYAKATALAPAVNALVEEVGTLEVKMALIATLACLYRLAGHSQASVPFANEALQLARAGDLSHLSVPARMQAVMLHLFYTGNAGKAAQIAERTLARMDKKTTVLHRVMFTLALAVARFRLTRTESRPAAVRVLEEGLAECQRWGAEFFVLHEWQLGLAAVIYGLAYDVQANFCLRLVRTMAEKLPQTVREPGIPLAEPESRMLPAAWQALPDEDSRSTFASLLTAADRRRVVTLARGPSPLTIQVLGPLVVTVGETPVDVRALKRRKSGQLLTLLVASEGPLPREQVVERLWPDLDPSAADTSLRVSLHHLRRLLEPHLGGKARSRYIHAEAGLVWFSRHPEVQVDLDRFREELRRAEEARDSGHLREAAGLLEQACRLYRGDLLADDPYELGDLREQWRARYAAALDWLGEYYWHELGSPNRAIVAFQRRLALDESHEPTHQSLIRIYLETGQVDRARRQYLACREALASQLGVEPSPATESLYQLIVQMESEAQSTLEPPLPPRR